MDTCGSYKVCVVVGRIIRETQTMGETNAKQRRNKKKKKRLIVDRDGRHIRFVCELAFYDGGSVG